MFSPVPFGSYLCVETKMSLSSIRITSAIGSQVLEKTSLSSGANGSILRNGPGPLFFNLIPGSGEPFTIKW